ncbi:hypothetical protein PoB_004491200 [Plakobranchus ocellatus]|uniref:SMB domain-containing protein n=1 Tax=Plakobranchus ocellatus TaxID=259542 RepID=A0AAV4BHG9_9GAST|nr:hypothetical protein PoB_004491200 [Plakobranchus ocellatus]
MSSSMVLFSLLCACVHPHLEEAKSKHMQFKSFRQESDLIPPFLNTLSNRDKSFSNQSALSSVAGKLHRNIRSVRRQDSKPTSARTTYPPSTPQPVTDSTAAHRSRLCQDIATEYAYREGLCGASDPEDYVSVARKRHTCKHRCGSARTVGEILFKCSCDELCLIHEDCCQDFLDECPKIYSKSERAKVHAGNLKADCGRTSFRVFIKDKAIHAAVWTTPDSYRAVSTIANNASEEEKTTAGIALGKLIRFVQFYQTADLASGLIYLNYDKFSEAALATSIPHFVPKFLEIDCAFIELKNEGKLSIAELLQHCDFGGISHMPTILHRSCQREGILSCHCDNNDILHEFLHNACLGRNISVPDMPRQPLHHKSAYALIEIFGDSVCMVSTEKLYFSRKRVGFAGLKEEDIFVARVVPFFPETNYLPTFSRHGSSRNGDNFSQATEKGSDNDQELDPFRPQDVKFAVELSDTLEKRFLCPGNASSLSKCLLLECAREALLSSNAAASALHFDGRSCEVPVRATVTSVYQAGVSLCTCLRVAVALADLQIWTSAVKRLTNGYCWIDLNILPVPQENDAFEKVYTFPHYDAFGNPILREEPVNFSNLLQRQLEQTKDKCAQTDILVCFFSSRGQTSANREAIQCVKVEGGEDGSQYQTSPCILGLFFAQFLIHMV